MDAELTISGVSQPAEEECRIARDGKPYTWLEFIEYFGESVAAKSWNSADIHRAAEEPVGASDGHQEKCGGGYEQGGIGNSEPAPSANSLNSGDTHPAADEHSYAITMLIEQLTQLACLSTLSTGVKSVRDANEKAHQTAEENMINICSQLRRDNLSWDQIIQITCYGEQEAIFKAYVEIAMYDVDRTEWQQRRGNIASAAGNTLLTHTLPPPPPMLQSASSTAGNIPVTPPPPPPPPQEGGAASAAVNTLLTPRTAADLKARTNIAGTGKREMRALLNQISESQPRAPTQLVHEIPADVPWRHYLARHADCKQIVGSGIVRVYLEFLPEIRDPNRDGQPRLDYVFENLEGFRCQLHPGGKGKDAKPIFTSVQR